MKRYFFLLIICIGLVSAYTVPSFDSVDLVLNTGYTAQTFDSVDLVLGVAVSSSNVAPTLIANSTAPTTVYTNTDWTINLTATDSEESYIDSYVQFYNDTAKIGGEYTFNMTNNTNHLVATLGSGNFSKYDNLTAQVWLSDRTDNSTKVNLTSIMVSNSAPVISTLQTVVNQNTSSTYTFDYNVTDADSDTITWTDNSSLFIIDSSTGIISDVPTETEDGTYSILITASDGTASDTDVFSYSINDTTLPVSSNIIWSTTGGFTDDTLTFNQVIDYINATCSDGNILSGCNITITDPDSVVVIDNLAMTNVSSNFTYTSDITLNKAGTWTINVTAIDSAGNVNSTTDTILVSIQTQSTKDGWYGYANNSYLTSTEITTLSEYGYDIFEFEENMTEIQASFSTLLTSINDSRNANIKSGINIILDFDYNNSATVTQYLTDITENFSSLDAVPYSDSVIYISLELESAGDYNTSIKDSVINDFAKNITGITNNAFVIYSKNYNSSGLDSSYIQYTTMLYLDSLTNAAFIEDQKSLFKNNASLNRMYTKIPDAVKTLAKDFHTRIIDNLRSIPNPSSLTNADASSLNNKDVIIFNNGSSSANFTINVSQLSLSGKDVWDSTEGAYIESNTDQNFSVEVTGYNATILYFEDLDHIQLDTFTYGTLYKGGTSSISYANHTDGNMDGSFGMAGAYDIEIELYDSHYKMATFLTYYGWLNVTSIDFSSYDVIIIADKNNAELDALNYTSTEVYGYISVADFNNTDSWNTAKEAEVDSWLALNDSLNIFVDGMDTGVGGTNFSSRMKDLVDDIQVTKGRKAILNTYTAYADFATWGLGGIMKESCVNRWNGASASAPDSYARENFTLELERSEWFTAHGVDVYCQAFNNKSTDGTNTIQNYTELQNIYYANLVLGYDYFYLSQPDFQYVHEEWVYDAGADLGRNAQQMTTDENTYYRAYENGIVYYNKTSEQGWIEDGLVVNDIQTCFYLYRSYLTNPAWEFTINNRQSIGSSQEYSVTPSMASYAWEWVCVDTSAETPINGRYLIEAWVGDHTAIAGQGYNLGWSSYAGSGIHSFYDTSTTDAFTAYPEDQNWMVNMSINISNKISVDTTTNINQFEVNGTNLRNVTINSTGSFDIEVWSKPTIYKNFGNVSYLNSSGEWDILNYINDSNCNTENPTWGVKTIDGGIYKACIDTDGENTTVRVVTPCLSEKIFQITDAGDFINPTFVTIPADDSITYGTDWDGVTFNATDETGFGNYSVNDSRFTINSTGFLDDVSILGAEVYSLNITINDTSGNENSTIYTLTVNKATPSGSLTSDLGWTINESQEVVIGLSETNTGDGDLTYEIYRDGVSKTTGETWSPTLGTYDYVLNSTGGANYSTIASMDSQTLTVNDVTNPLINYTTGTELNNTYLNQDFIFVNVSVTETNEDTIIFNLYNSTQDNLNSSSFNDSTRTINWTNLTDGIYYYNVTINDTSGNENSTDTRIITFDSTSPNVSIITPIDGYNIPNYVSGSLPIVVNYSVNDTNLDSCKYEVTGSQTIANTSTACSNGYNTINLYLSVSGTFNVTVYSNDSAGNEESDTFYMTVSVYTGPQSGGGASETPEELEEEDYDIYNKIIVCNKVDYFLGLYGLNYTEDQFEALMNSLSIEFGMGMDTNVLTGYITDYDNLCLNITDDGTTLPDEPEEEKDDRIFWSIIIGAVILLIILAIVLDFNFWAMTSISDKKKR